jgi:hypothetical protein
MCGAGGCDAVPGGVATYFGSDQPRITAEVTIPWPALGIRPARVPEAIRLAVAVTGFHGARWMTGDGTPPDETLAHPGRWPRVPLGR